MLYFFYSAFYTVALAFLLPFEYLKRPHELRRRWLFERLGYYAGERVTGRTVWVHAVSVGEVIASVPLVKKIKQKHPSLSIVISTVTDTGQKVAMDLAGGLTAIRAEIIYVPFDLPFAVRNAVRRIRPSAFIIMETELWPNNIRMLQESSVPVVLMNGRLSERSYKRYKKLVFFIGEVLRDVSILCVQDEIYARRFRDLGAASDRIKVIGSFKFDTQSSSTAPDWTKALRGPVIIAGSTHETEEELVLDAHARLKSDFPSLNLIVAPRHPGRFKAVEELIKKRGLKYTKRSEIAAAVKTDSGQAGMTKLEGQVILLDVMGELAAVYGAADIAVMGGSFIEHGGQNPLEPASWGKVVVCGPHMENFPFIGDFYAAGERSGQKPPVFTAS